jgi:hypothetical protein
MEGEGKKGGNNVSSFLLKTLRLLNFMQEGNQGKELNVVFDNCGGQNKNNFVLLLVPYLIEMGYFKSVNFIFLVVGHTKNAADRLFNLLKMVYRKSNVQTFGSLIGVCGKSPHVTPIAVFLDGDFLEYSVFLLEFYNSIKDIREQHIFSCSVQSDGSIYNPLKQLLLTVRKLDLDEHAAVSKNSIKKTFPNMKDEEYDPDPIAARPTIMKAYGIKTIPLQGIPDFKRMQLYKNYRKHIDPIYLDDDLYAEPIAKAYEREKKDQEDRKKVKDDRKRKKHVA